MAVTVIVLIILALITINATIGENGLFSKAQEIQGYFKNAQIADEEIINNILEEIEENTNSNNTGKEETTVANTLKIGDYVYYVDNDGNENKCVVMYDKSSQESNYEVQIIFAEVDTYNSFMVEYKIYNSMINDINNACSIYLNDKYASKVRQVGSIPNNPSEEGDLLEFFDYGFEYKDEDQNYIIDYNRMNELDILEYKQKGGNYNYSYHLASRVPGFDGFTLSLYTRLIDSNGKLGKSSQLFFIQNDEIPSTLVGSGMGAGLRPVLTLIDNVKIISGTGTEQDPYRFE